MTIREYHSFCPTEMKALYESVGWVSYLRREDLLEKAFAASLQVLAAYEGETLVGIIRAVGDGQSILYIQDLLVHPAHQRKGVGARLTEEMLRRFPDVNQTVLLTDDEESTVLFYEKQGFRKVQKAGLCAFIRLHGCYQE